MITLHQVSKYYGRQDVLRNVGLHVGPGERIGLVGRNGAGKSTLLKVMLGEITPDSGEVYRTRNLRMGHLPQHLIELRGQTVLELAMDTGDRLAEVETELEDVHQALAKEPGQEKTQELLARQGQLHTIFEGLGGYDLEARAEKTLAGLGFGPEKINRDVSELSGGWLMRAALARILLSQPDIILLDEPTNHLDLESLIWLENHLIQSPASLVLVSHDRAFMDKVINCIVEVDECSLFTYGGNYTNYQEQRESRRKAQQAAYESQQERIREINNFIDRNRSRKSSAKQVQSRLKMLEKMERLTPPESDDALKLEMPPCERSANVVVELLGVDLAYGSNQVYKGLDFSVRRLDKIAFLGRNGQGKSTLLKLLSGQVKPDKGRRLVGGRVKMAVFSQHALDDLNPENDVLEELSSVAGLMPLSRLRSVLGVFLFRGDQVFKKVKVLSGGERSRLVLAKLFMQAPNFLLMDEPTNHLDVQGREVLENALKDYQGTLIIITHDRALIDQVADKVAYVAGGDVTVFPGNYKDFNRLWKDRLQEPVDGAPPASSPSAQAAQKASAKPAPEKDSEKKNRKAKRKAQAEARNKLYRKIKPMKQELAKVEDKVERLTTLLDELVEQMVSLKPQEDWEKWQELNQAHNRAKDKLEKYTNRWEELALSLEEAQAELE